MLAPTLTRSAVYGLDQSGNVTDWNASAGRLLGFGAEQILGSHYHVFFTEEDRAAGLPQRSLAMAIAHGKFESEGWRRRQNGERFWASIELDSVVDEHRGHLGFTEIVCDLTEHKRLLQQTRDARDNLDLALGHMTQGLCLFDAHERIVVTNPRFAELLGIDAQALLPGRTYTDVLWLHATAAKIVPDDIALHVEEARQRHGAALREGRAVKEELLVSGRLIVFALAKAGSGWIATVEDVTERRRTELEVIHLARHDPLTDLPNRAAFRDALVEALCAPERTSLCALFYIDLDRFKLINDNFGHAVGDEVLKVSSARIRQNVRPHDVVARLGGDEFIVLCCHLADKQAAFDLGERLLLDLRAPLASGPESSLHAIALSASIGIALAGADLTDPDRLIQQADFAMYTAKHAQRGTMRIYDETMQDPVRDGRALEANLRRTLEEGGFSLAYQPIVDTRRDKVTHFETFLRWRHPTRGDVLPGEFIPFAEKIELMPAIDEWVIGTACREAMSWPSDIAVSVNLSPSSLQRLGLVGVVRAALAQSGLAPERLEIEITETGMMADSASATMVVQGLRHLGVRIAVDDFGTGYSSLSLLRDLPVGRVKIDGSFVRDFGTVREAGVIVRAVIGICAGLDVAVTAEGVESVAQAELLRREGCYLHQGYLISQPMQPKMIQSWLDARRRARVIPHMS